MPEERSTGAEHLIGRRSGRQAIDGIDGDRALNRSTVKAIDGDRALNRSTVWKTVPRSVTSDVDSPLRRDLLGTICWGRTNARARSAGDRAFHKGALCSVPQSVPVLSPFRAYLRHFCRLFGVKNDEFLLFLGRFAWPRAITGSA
jgi:hypothetical protein